MRLIFIRHAQPDYSIDGLTEKGKVEAQLLAKRTANWDVDRFFCSPLGRAKDTAEPTLKALNREVTICDWLQEFHYRVEDPYTKDLRVPWDYFPEFFTTQPLMLDPDKWYDCDLYKTNPEIKSKWFEVCNGLDDILKSYGYTRNGKYYDYKNPDGPDLPAEIGDIQTRGIMEYQVRDEDDNKTIVFFCHLGVECVMLAHLLSISPVTLWHGAFEAPSSVTVVNAEKRYHNQAFFRIQALGDTSHLYAAGEPVSGFGAFSTVFSK